MSEITVVDGFVKDYYKDMGLVNTYPIPEQLKYTAQMYSIPNDSGCTITTNVKPTPKFPHQKSFARLDDAGKLIEFNMDVAMAGAQAFANGNRSPANMSCLLMMALLDRIVDSSYCFDRMDDFRTFIKKFEVATE